MLSIEYYSVSVAKNLFQYVPDVTKIFKEVILSAWVTVSQTLGNHYVSATYLHTRQAILSANVAYWKMILSHKCPKPQDSLKSALTRYSFHCPSDFNILSIFCFVDPKALDAVTM